MFPHTDIDALTEADRDIEDLADRVGVLTRLHSAL